MGTARTAQLHGLQAPLQIWSDADLQGPDTVLWPELVGRVCAALRDQLADFTTSVRQGCPSAIADLSDAVETLRIAEAIIDASRLGSAVSLA